MWQTVNLEVPDVVRWDSGEIGVSHNEPLVSHCEAPGFDLVYCVNMSRRPPGDGRRAVLW